MQKTVTNISNLHTCPVCSVHLFTAMILVMDSQLLQLTGDMVRGTSVHVPVCVNAVGACGRLDLPGKRDHTG